MSGFFTTRHKLAYILILISLMPSLLNLFGVDFSSPQLQPAVDGGNSPNNVSDIATGVIYHALLEWSAVVIAMVATLLSFFHYSVRRDITVPIIGIAFFCAGMLDAFHVLAASKIIEAKAANVDFIPFTWALSRIFNPIVMLFGVSLNFWIERHRWQNSAMPKPVLYSVPMLISISLAFVVFAYAVVHISANSEYLPQTMYPEAYITRPFDILPLALFLFVGALFWVWFNRGRSVIKFALLLSIVPEVATQLHMVFGSTSLFDNHFNIAHGLKIIAYSVILFGVLIDTINRSSDNERTLTSHVRDNKVTNQNIEGILDVGRAKRSLNVQFPVAVFLLSIVIAFVVSVSFYSESERLVLRQQAEGLRANRDQIESIFTDFYRQMSQDLVFLSKMAVIQNLIKSKSESNNKEVEYWREEASSVFGNLLINKQMYSNIRFFSIIDDNEELLKVIHNDKRVYVPHASMLGVEENEEIITSVQSLQPEELYFSNIEFIENRRLISKPNQLMLQVVKPIFSSITNEIYGGLIIEIDFSLFIEHVLNDKLFGFDLYLGTEEGTLLYFPQLRMFFDREKNKYESMQKIFPELDQYIKNDTLFKEFSELNDTSGNSYTSTYHFIDLRDYGSQYPLRLLLQHKNDATFAELNSFRNRSFLLGMSMSLVALSLAILVSRRVVQPLSQMTEAVEIYELSGKVEKLPTYSNNEIGVLARSFHNVLIRMNQMLLLQQQSANNVKETSERLKAIVNSAADAIITLDSENKILSFNTAAQHMFGYTENEIMGDMFNVLITLKEINADRDEQDVDKLIFESFERERELHGRQKNGELFSITMSLTQVDTSSGKIFTALVRDISVSKAREEQLAEARKYIDGIASSAPFLFAYIDNSYTHKFVNKNYEKWFGIPCCDILGRSIKDLISESEYLEILPYLEKTMEGHATSFDLQITRENITQRFIHVTYTPDRMSDGSVVGFFSSIEDISDAKFKEEKLKELSWRLDFALTAAGVGVWDYNIKTNELIWDERMHQLYGIKVGDYENLGEAIKKLIHPADYDITTALLKHSLKTGVDFNPEFRVCWPNGEIHYLQANSKLLANDSGEYLRMIGTNVDITDQKILADDREKALEKAKETAKLKSEFLASMSHEIRTPMNGVLGMLGLLMRSKLEKTQRRHAEIARTSAESLLTIINDILDFSKVEAGKIELEILDFNLRTQLGDFAESMAHKAHEKGLEVVLDVRQINHSIVRGDPGRLRQILTNLVGNAVKFTSQGEIIIRAEVKEEGEEYLRFCCSIHDTGIGMRKEQLGTIFDSFTQVDASTTRKYGGTGLGLAIVKKICLLMHGDIDVSSEPERGSCFTFNIRLQKSERSQAVLPHVDIRDMGILVVDDNATNRSVLVQQFESWGANVTEADSGKQALDVIQKMCDRHIKIFPVAFLDMQMPEMNGAELGKLIRADHSLDEMKLIMMTSMSSRGDAKYFADLGFNGYFPKPATTTDLFDALSVLASGGEVLNNAEPLLTRHYLHGLQRTGINADANVAADAADIVATDDTISTMAWPENCRLLLVEDNHINQEVAIGLLQDMSLECDIAGNGIEALAALEQSLGDSPFHIILMDCQMPELDGYETSKMIRTGKAGERYQQMPIVAMTANAMKGDREKCLAAGMSDYLTKPIDPEELERKLRQWLLNAGKTQTLRTPTPPAENNQVDDDINNGTTWDMASALSRVRGKDQRLAKLVQIFIDNMPKQMSELEHAIEQKSAKAVQDMAHSIKGVAGNLSAIDLMEIATEIETAGREENLSNIQQQWATISARYQTLFTHLSAYLEGRAQ